MLFSTPSRQLADQPPTQQHRFSKAGLAFILLVSVIGITCFTPMLIRYVKEHNGLSIGLASFSLVCYVVSFAGSLYGLLKRRTKS